MTTAIKNKVMSLPLWLYIILWLFFIYLFMQILNFRVGNSNNIITTGMYFIEFGVHEISHMIVFFLPKIFVFMAGSIGEICFTLLLLVETIKEKSYFASVFAGLWIMLAMNSVGRYIADATNQLLPLAGPSEAVQHDWHYILGQFGLLSSDAAIGNVVCTIGNIIGLLALVFGLWLIIVKIKTKLHPVLV